MSIQNLMKLIEEVYSYRHTQNLIEGARSNKKIFYYSVAEYMISKYQKQKKMLDQATIDFLTSLDYFKR